MVPEQARRHVRGRFRGLKPDGTLRTTGETVGTDFAIPSFNLMIRNVGAQLWRRKGSLPSACLPSVMSNCLGRDSRAFGQSTRPQGLLQAIDAADAELSQREPFVVKRR